MKKLFIYASISLLNTILITIILPSLFKHMSSYYFVLFAACIIGILALIVMLFKEIAKRDTKELIVRLSFMVGLVILSILIVNVLTGFMAEVIYSLLKNSKSLEEIKSVIDHLVRVITVFVIPLFISLFWNTAYDNKSVIEAIEIDKKCYIKLLCLLVVFIIVGIMIGYLPQSTLGIIVQNIMLIVISILAIYLTEYICKNNKIKEA